MYTARVLSVADRLNRKARKPIHNFNLQKPILECFVRVVFESFASKGAFMYYPFSEPSTPFLHFFYDFFIVTRKPAETQASPGEENLQKMYFRCEIAHNFASKFFSFFA